MSAGDAPMNETNTALPRLQALLDGGKDNALLRFGLGFEYLRAGDAAAATVHLQQAVVFDPAYSAAWKMLGKSLAQAGRNDEALSAYRNGIAAAEKKGDKQAMKEMQVFVRRLAKVSAPE
jgi:Tfp pilus assembly protein PilF